MASQQMNLSVVLRAVNLLSGPVQRAMKSLEDIDRTAERATGLKNMARDLDSVGGSLVKIGGLTAGAGIGGAHVLGLTAVPGQAVAAQHALRQIGNTADLTAGQIAAAGPELQLLSRETNQYQSALIEGLGTLAAAGLEFDRSMAALRPIGRTATAAGAELNDVANTSFALIDNLKLPVGELQFALDVLAQSGKEGRFELADMAQYFPVITASAQQLNMTGVPAIASLGAALQVAMKGAGDPSQAATNFQNFLNKLTSPETVTRFEKLGINLQREFAKATAAGKDPILEFLQLIDRVSEGDAFKMGEMFGDQQVLQFLRPMLANLEEYERIRAKALDSRGVVDEDYLNMMSTLNEQWRQLRINMAAAVGPSVTRGMELVNRGLSVMNENPWLRNLTLGGLVFTTIAGGLIAGLGTMLMFAGGVLAAAGPLINGMAAARAGWLGLHGALEGGPKLIGLLVNGLRRAGPAIANFGRLLLTSPIAWAALAIAGAAYLIYRNWDTIGPFLADVWGRIRGIFSSGIDWIQNLNWRQAGANLLVSLWEGMKEKASLPIDLARNVAGRIGNFFIGRSPPPEGALRRLNQPGLMETLALALKPAPVVGAARVVAAATAGALLMPVGTLAQPPQSLLPTFANESGATVIQLHYSPVFHVAPGTPAETRRAVEEASQIAKADVIRELEENMLAVHHRNQRKSYRREG